MNDEEKLREYGKFHEWLGRRLQSAKDSYDFPGFTNEVSKEHRVLDAKLRKAPHDCCSPCSDPKCPWVHHAPLKPEEV